MSYIFGRYITPEGVANIRKHKYKSGGYTALENILEHYWQFVSDWCPRSIAPNTITLVGGVIVFIAMSFMLYYDMSMTQPLPAWTYLTVSVSMWVQNTLDNIDGKQARKTGSSSPLGQLFDHGLDAITWSICALSIVISLQLGMSTSAIIAMISVMAPFFLTNILEHYSGVFEYSVGGVGGTNGLILMVIFSGIPFFAGPGVYDTAIKDVFTFIPAVIAREFVIRDMILTLVCACTVQYCGSLIFLNLTSVKGFGYKVTVVLQMLQSFTVFAYMFMLDDKIEFVHNNAGWLYLSLIILFWLISTKIIVWNMAGMYFSYFHFEYLIFGIYFYFQYTYTKTPEHEQNLMYAFIVTFVIILVLYLRLVQNIISQLTEDLGIYCFSLEKRQKIKEN